MQGVSAVSFNCRNTITIGNNVIIGVGPAIWDADLHPVDENIRRLRLNDKKKALI